jgi:hypothetical protein
MKKIQLNISVGIFRFWIALNILVFLYMLPNANKPLDEADIVPDYIYYLARIPYGFFKELLGIPSFTSTLTTDILWALSVTLSTGLTSLIFLLLVIWIIRGFKK